MRILIVSFILLFCFPVNKISAQADSIFYRLNTKIVRLIENEINRNKEFYKPTKNIPFLVWENYSDTITCFLSSLATKEPSNDNSGAKQEYFLVKNSNRYLAVGNYILPIIFTNDMEFTIGRNILSEGYRICFTRDYIYFREYFR